MYDPTTQALLRHVDALGYTLVVSLRGEGVEVVAQHGVNGERFVIRADDPYAAACELAKLCGFDLEG